MATYSYSLNYYVSIVQSIYLILLSEFIELSALTDITKLLAQLTALIWALVSLIKMLKNKEK